jgi:histone acetyltransferase (RNA polymerase elongator complex component)
MKILPVFIPQQGCPFKCIYCDQQQFGSVQRLDLSELKKQVESFCRKNAAQEKQIAFYGGTFTGLSEQERENYYRIAEPHLDAKTTLRISTRPDEVSREQLEWCRKHQVRTIELGIQDFSEAVLQASGRGYGNATATEACLRVKQAGFELGVQLMPGLPGSNKETFNYNLKSLISIKPDFLRIYPVVILSGTVLWDEWQAGRYEPLGLDEAIEICIRICELAERMNIKVIKLGIPALAPGTEWVGPYHPVLGELIKIERLVRKAESIRLTGREPDLKAAEYKLLWNHKGYGMKRLQQRLEVAGKANKLSFFSAQSTDHFRTESGRA